MNLYESINTSIKRNPYVESISRNYNLDYTNADVMSDYIDYIDDYIIGEGHNLTKDDISDVFVDLFDDGRVPPKGFDRAKVEEALCEHYRDYLNEAEEKEFTIKQTAGSFGTYSLCDWKAESPEKAIEEFIEKNPEFKDNKKGHITAVAKTIKEADDKKCVLCGKHFREWGNDPWPLAEEGWCCDKCNMDKVVPARIALAYKKEEPKTEEKKEAEYGDGARHYSNALIDLCEQGIVSWENVAHGLINYCSEDDIKDFCDSYQYTDLIDNPTGDDSLEDEEV